MTAAFESARINTDVLKKQNENISETTARPSRMAAGFGAFTALIGFTVLLGWITDVDVLKSVVPGFISMLPTTAVCFLAAGYSLWLLRFEHTTLPERSSTKTLIGRSLAGFVLLVAIAM